MSTEQWLMKRPPGIPFHILFEDGYHHIFCSNQLKASTQKTISDLTFKPKTTAICWTESSTRENPQKAFSSFQRLQWTILSEKEALKMRLKWRNKSINWHIMNLLHVDEREDSIYFITWKWLNSILETFLTWNLKFWTRSVRKWSKHQTNGACSESSSATLLDPAQTFPLNSMNKLNSPDCNFIPAQKEVNIGLIIQVELGKSELLYRKRILLDKILPITY